MIMSIFGNISLSTRKSFQLVLKEMKSKINFESAIETFKVFKNLWLVCCWKGHWKPLKGCSLILTAALQGNRLSWQLFQMSWVLEILTPKRAFKSWTNFESLHWLHYIFDVRFQSGNSVLFVYRRPVRWDMIRPDVWINTQKTERKN